MDRGGATRGAARRAPGDGLARHAHAGLTRAARPADRARYGLPPDPELARWHAVRVPHDAAAGAAQPGRPDARRDPPDPARWRRTSRSRSTPDWVARARSVGPARGHHARARRCRIRPRRLAPLSDAFADLDAEVVVTTRARDRRRSLLGAVPHNVRVAPYVPMSRLLPTCDVLAFHGGSGTMLAALSAGVPAGAHAGRRRPARERGPLRGRGRRRDRRRARRAGSGLGPPRGGARARARRALRPPRAASATRSARCRRPRRSSSSSNDSWRRAIVAGVRTNRTCVPNGPRTC